MKANDFKYACFIEDELDLEKILEKVEKNKSLFIPLDLRTFLLCKEHNLRIFDFYDLIKNEFHKKANKEAKNFTQNLRFTQKIPYSLKSEIIGYLRFRLHSIIFIIEIIENLINKYHINEIIVSGLKNKTHYLHKAKIISEIAENLFPSLTTSISKENIIKTEYLDYYEPKNLNLNNKKKILITNGGYNFKRICSFFRKHNFNVYLPIFNNISLKEKLVYFLRGIRTIDFSKKKKIKIEEKFFIENIKFLYDKNYDLSMLLNIFYKKLNLYFNKLNLKMNSLKTFIRKNKFDLMISNIARGLDGSILDADIKEPSLLIPHGVISNAFNKDDEIYKKNIAEAVFNGESKFIAIQSKIMKNSLQTHKIAGEALITGNLIFSNTSDNRNQKKYVLYATTLKDFTNLQYLGVDMFYEFWKILEDLNEISCKKNEKIVVKLHPHYKHSINIIKKYFKFLVFSNARIDRLLKNASSIVTLSSGTIEDALNSKVPVILYDRKSRYKQMNIFENKKENQPVLYVNKKKELYDMIEKVRNYKNLNFDSYIYNYDIEEILYNKILPLTKK